MVITVIAALAGGCSRHDSGGESQSPDGSGAHQQGVPHEEHSLGDGVVRIEPTMLRDLRVTTAKVTVKPGGDVIAALGQVGVNQNAFAEISAPLAGRISGLHVQAGQTVRRGQALASLESPELGTRRAAVTRARAELSTAERTYQRKQKLGAERIVPMREVADAEALVTSAGASLSAAVAELSALGGDAARGEGGGLSLTSPVSGTVLERQTVLGRFVAPGDLLFRIGSMQTLWVTVNVFERDAIRVQPGTNAKLVLPAYPGKSFDAVVVTIGREVDDASRTLPVRLDVPNQEQLLRPGMSATAWLQVGARSDNLLVVPSAAMQRLEDGWVVFVPGGPGEFDVRAVGRGRDLGDDVEVLSGLSAGESVVVDGAFLLKAEAEKSGGGGDEHGH